MSGAARPGRTRPEDLTFGVEDRPPAATLAALAVQHVLMALMFCLYAVIAGQAIGLQGEALGAQVGTSIFLVGLLTVLHGMAGRFGTGMVMVGVPSPMLLGVWTATLLTFGPAATMGAVLVSNLVVIGFAGLLPRLRPAFPPAVVGVVVLALGLSLVAGGVSRSLGLTPEAGTTAALPASGVAGPALTAGATLAVIVALSIWGGARLRIQAVLLGTLCGLAAAIATGQAGLDMLAEVAALPVLALPFLGLSIPMPRFEILAIAPILLVQVISAIDTLADALALDRMTDAKWRRADMRLAGRAVGLTSAVNLICGLVGTLPLGTSSGNVGLVQATGAASRHVGLASGAMLMAVAFLPQVSGLIIRIPDPVIGGFLVFTAAYLITAGMDLALSRLLDARRSFTIGLSVVAGGTVLLLPDLVQAAPGWVQPVLGSAPAVAALLAIALNLLFRLGAAQTGRLVMQDAGASREAVEFLEHHGRIWGARREVVARAGLVVEEVVETLSQAGLVQGPVTLVARFDEFNLLCILSYQGKPPALGGQAAPDLEAALEGGEAEMELAMRQVSAGLITRMADRVQAVRLQGRLPSRAEVRLHFAH